MSLQGTLDSMSVIDLFAWIESRRHTGEVSLVCGSEERDFFVENGALVRAGSNKPTEFLGQMLVNVGYIDADTLDNLQKTQSITKTSIGKTLVDAGQMDPTVLLTTLELKIRESFYAAMAWETGNFVFSATRRTAPFVEFEVRVSIDECIREGESRAADWKRVRRAIPDDDTRLLVPNPLWLERAKPGSPSALLLGDIQAGLCVRDIILARHSLPFPVYMHLAELMKRGIIVIDPKHRGSSGSAVLPGVPLAHVPAPPSPLPVAARPAVPPVGSRVAPMTLADDEKDASLTMDRAAEVTDVMPAPADPLPREAGNYVDDEELTPVPARYPERVRTPGEQGEEPAERVGQAESMRTARAVTEELDLDSAIVEDESVPSIPLEDLPLLEQARAHADAGNVRAALSLVESALADRADDPDVLDLHKKLERKLFAELSRALLGKYRVPRLLREAEELAASDLDKGERYLVEHIDGKWDLLSIMRAAPLRPVEVLIGVKSLAERGFISLE